MKKNYTILFFVFIFSTNINAQIKILFDATKAETAGNADWIIDADLFNIGYSAGPANVGSGNEANAQRIPTPAQSGITATTSETYWKGGLSYWAVDCVKKGYQVETLPYNGSITYGNTTNTQDLSNYKIFVVVEPNIVFSTAEKTALINFVQNGGSLFMVSDHTVSDRNNDGWDSPAIWNDLFTNNGIKTNPFGIEFDLATISGSSSNISSYTNDSLLHGSYGNVTQVLWSSGTTITINTTANPTVKAAVYKSGASNTGSTNVMVAYARYGLGKVVAVGDSSPFDDGTGDTNDQLYDGYITDANGNHQKLIMNATVWLATQNPLPVKLSSFTCTQNKNNILLNWHTENEINASHFNIQKSIDGKNFETIGTVAAKGVGDYNYINQLTTNYYLPTTIYYRLQMVDKDGSIKYSEVKTVNNQLSTVNAISLYPNPAKDYISLQMINNNINQVNIYNIYGKQVFTKSINSSNVNLNIQSLSTGLYCIKAFNSNGFTYTTTFIKN